MSFFDVNFVFREIPSLKQRIAGKSLPIEKFAVAKSERFINGGRLPLCVLVSVWIMTTELITCIVFIDLLPTFHCYTQSIASGQLSVLCVWCIVIIEYQNVCPSTFYSFHSDSDHFVVLLRWSTLYLFSTYHPPTFVNDIKKNIPILEV